MYTAHATFDTSNAARYVKQLFKHFAHKVEVEYDDSGGQTDLPGGHLTLTAGDAALTICITGDDLRGVTKARYIFEDHLIRFAFRESVTCLTWSVTESAEDT